MSVSFLKRGIMRKQLKLRNGEYYHFDKMKITGIINVTPNSFFQGSRRMDVEEAVKRARQMKEEGADILDIGGESTRPGVDPVSPEEEIQRIIPVIEAIKKEMDILISVDTYHAETAEASLIAGADIINDVTGLKADPNMAKICAKYNAPIIIMHMKKDPKTMHQDIHYDDFLGEVREFFQEQIKYAIAEGNDPERLILDPGVGFAKNYDHNIEIIQNLESFYDFDLPILLAVSRKTFIGKILDGAPPEDRLEGTIAVSCWAAERGIEMIRVHDVLENTRAIRVMEALK